MLRQANLVDIPTRGGNRYDADIGTLDVESGGRNRLLSGRLDGFGRLGFLWQLWWNGRLEPGVGFLWQLGRMGLLWLPRQLGIVRKFRQLRQPRGADTCGIARFVPSPPALRRVLFLRFQRGNGLMGLLR